MSEHQHEYGGDDEFQVNVGSDLVRRACATCGQLQYGTATFGGVDRGQGVVPKRVTSIEWDAPKS